jgi:hypothetical protein
MWRQAQQGRRTSLLIVATPRGAGDSHNAIEHFAAHEIDDQVHLCIILAKAKIPLTVPMHEALGGGPTNQCEFVYWTDYGNLAGLRYNQLEAVFREQQHEGPHVWPLPLAPLREPLPFNLRKDPFQRATDIPASGSTAHYSRAVIGHMAASRPTSPMAQTGRCRPQVGFQATPGTGRRSTNLLLWSRKRLRSH